MASGITREMRVRGWNTRFLDASGLCFAGIYQRDDLLTVAQVWAELNLCFELPPRPPDIPQGLWEPALLHKSAASHSDIIYLRDDSAARRPFPSPRCGDVALYHFVYHDSEHCVASTSTEGEATQPRSSLDAPCVRKLPKPSRRYDARYLPPNKLSADPRIAVFPTRRMAKATSPTKRSVSGSPSRSRSASPTKDADTGEAIPIPESSTLPLETARQEISRFRQRCLTGGQSCCAVTGLGKAWVPNSAVGPAIQAAHIVPQIHYHLYPLGPRQGGVEQLASPEDKEALGVAWLRTWSMGNGLLLVSHIHQLFDARLISIDPDTLRIRAFMPYDLITPYHGKIASLDESLTDINALQHHWDMCCIENMAAASLADPAPPAPILTPSNPALVLQPGRSDEATPADLHRDPDKRARQGDGSAVATSFGGRASGGTPPQTALQGPTPPPSEHDHGQRYDEHAGDPSSRKRGSVGGSVAGAPKQCVLSVESEDVVLDDESPERGRPRKKRRCVATLQSE